MKDLTFLLLSGLVLMQFEVIAQGILPDSSYAIAYNNGNDMSIVAGPNYDSDLIDVCKSRDTLKLIEYYGDFYLKVQRLNSDGIGYLHIKFLMHDKNAVELINRIAVGQGYPSRLKYSPLPLRDDYRRKELPNSKTFNYSDLPRSSAPSYSPIYTGPRGGKYRINSKGNRTYIKRK